MRRSRGIGKGSRDLQRSKRNRRDAAVVEKVRDQESRFQISKAEDNMVDMKAPWMRIAHALEGEAEITGSAANPRIVEMFKVAGLPPDDPDFRSDETAWCAAFVNACLQCSGYQGTKSALANSFAQFGADLGRTPQPGCIVLFKPLSEGASGHVAFYVGDDGDSIRVLGGNQSDKVKVAAFPMSKWRAYRWPSQTAPLPASTTLPTILTLAPTEAPDHLHASGVIRPSSRPLIKPIAADNFARIQPIIEQWEGGFSDHPADPGGATNMGITQETLRQWRHQDVTADDVRALQRDEARQIFRAKYWEPLRCDEMPIALALMTYNAGVNAGIGRGARWLQEALNKQGEELDVDGTVGPLTLSACARADATRAVNDFAEIQEVFYRSLPIFPTFGKGWMNRLTDVRAKALAMASESPGTVEHLPLPGPFERFRHEVESRPEISTTLIDVLMQRIQRLEDTLVADKARRDDTQFRPPGDMTIFPPSGEVTFPTGPNDISAWLERLMTLVRRLQPQGTTTATTLPLSASQLTEQLRKALEVLTTIIAPGTDDKSRALGQVNGALGETLGNLLNGKKTAIGVLGAVLTSVLSQVPAASGLGQVLALLTPAVGLSPFAMPIFLAVSAWGILGKFEKWAHGTAPLPTLTK
jgi:uncharacterized protein (TIGR02594 family)